MNPWQQKRTGWPLYREAVDKVTEALFSPQLAPQTCLAPMALSPYSPYRVHIWTWFQLVSLRGEGPHWINPEYEAGTVSTTSILLDSFVALISL